MKIGIIDPFGSPYHDDSLLFKGLGGSEQAVIHMSRQLDGLFDYDITVYTNAKHFPGIAQAVKYRNIADIENESFDVLISNRTIMPFHPNWQQFTRGIEFPDFSTVTAKHKILWMHDTFVDGDSEIFSLIESGRLDKIFFVSEWQRKSFEEGHKRELPAGTAFITSNGVRLQDLPGPWEKEFGHFVYNAAAYKGLVPLIRTIWPEVQRLYPETRLTVIGGYYAFGEGEYDSNYETVQELETFCEENSLNVVFTGIITPYQVAAIVSRCCAMLYPISFPETYGISAMEAQAYGTPLITYKLGAFEDTLDPDCHYILANETQQEKAFIEAVKYFMQNPVERKKKVKNCLNAPINTWGKVAEQWDQYFQGLSFEEEKKRILIAVPSAKHIEPETFKSIYDLIIPEGFEADFEFFWCYLIDAGRNTIAGYAIENGYDYLFAVDADMAFPPDTLQKLLSHDEDFVTGVYRMRRPDQVIELYDTKYQQIDRQMLDLYTTIEIGGCGFGCALVKTKVLKDVGYPQFEYHQAYHHGDTFSEDNDFCQKARNLGYKIWVDTTVRCSHKGTIMWEIV
jgi:glycosyltransferase involved in cell wall biosynthesis